MIKAVFLDLDDTLYDYRGAMAGCEERLFALAGEGLGVSVHRCRLAYRRAKADLYANRPTDPAIFDWRERISNLIARLGQTADPQYTEHLFVKLWDDFMSVIRPYPDVVPALKALRLSGKRTAIISNGMREQQAAKVKQLGLSQLVDVEVYSEDVGTNKPDRAIFSRALSELGIRPEESVMVGDLCCVDVKGGRGASMFMCWLRRGAFADLVPKNEAEQPNFTISSLTQLDAMLRAL